MKEKERRLNKKSAYTADMKIFLIVIVVLLALWIVYSLLGSRVKEPAYIIVDQKEGYEIRRYESYVEARTVVAGNYGASMSDAFRILAGYIFGDNTSNTKVAMTAPVIESKSEKIAMTAPVLESGDGAGQRIVSFVMPAEYTLETLPIPNDKRVELVEVPAHTVAVKKFSGIATAKRMDKKKAELLVAVAGDELNTVGVVRGARYNPPSTFPLLNRNEVMITIQE